MQSDETPPPSSQVHTHETNGFFIGDDSVEYSPSTYERFRHSAWNRLRHLTYNALRDAGTSQKSLDRFAQCGSCCQVSYSKSGKRLYLCCSNCKNRFCHPCADARRSTVSRNLTAFAGKRHLRLITLTIAHHERPLPDLISRLYTCFKLMRKEPEFRRKVTGFAAFVEIKWTRRTNWWHVHFHILCEGEWWDRRDLSALWHKVTGDSYITDIREVTSEEGIRYTAKYASKPFSLADIPEEQRSTAINALSHRRLWLIGGTWKGIARLLTTEPLPGDLECLGSFSAIVDDAKRGDAEAAEIIKAIIGGLAIEYTKPDDDIPDS